MNDADGPALPEALDVAVPEGEVFVSRTEVTPELIIAYARAVGETNPRFLDPSVPGGMVAPPTFYYATRFEGGGRPRERSGVTTLLAADHAEFFGEVRPGDVLTCWARPLEGYTKTGRSGTLHFTVTEFRWVNQRGETVIRVRRSSAASSSIQPNAST